MHWNSVTPRPIRNYLKEPSAPSWFSSWKCPLAMLCCGEDWDRSMPWFQLSALYEANTGVETTQLWVPVPRGWMSEIPRLSAQALPWWQSEAQLQDKSDCNPYYSNSVPLVTHSTIILTRWCQTLNGPLQAVYFHNLSKEKNHKYRGSLKIQFQMWKEQQEEQCISL